ncbi:MAG: 50S ribosomal protein L10 [Actinobacteria bacterium]|nr:50S ribosomal protein L10 [Actinomycetota bacterium]
MARPDKAAAVAELTEDFRTATATVLTEYRGLSVTLMKKLRRDLGSDTKYAVVKNTLTKIAAKEAGFDVPAELLTGPSALAFIKGDAIVAAKSLRDFAKENPFLIIKGGIYEGKNVTAAEIFKLADLESREVLLAKLAGAMKATMANAIRTIDALRIKKEEAEGPVAVVEAPVAEAVVEAVVEEVPAVTEEVQTPVDAAVEAAEEEKE